MYYVINDLEDQGINNDADDLPFLEIHEELLINPGRGWHSGEVLRDAPTKVIEIEATPHFGYQGPPPDYYDDSIALMSPRLAEILQAKGVSNIQLFPAIIRYRKTGEEYAWFAFNIVGLVSAIDFQNSDVFNSDGNLLTNSSINGFKIDNEKACEQPLFRLAENVMVTVVRADIKIAIEAAGINSFSFSNTEDWIQV